MCGGPCKVAGAGFAGPSPALPDLSLSMQIALLHYTLPPVIGGVERIVRDQAAALESLGHEVLLFDRSAESREAFKRVLLEECQSQMERQGASLAVLVHNVLTMPFDLEWAAELRQMASESAPAVLWINWVHDVAAVNPYYAHLPWQEERYALLAKPVIGTVTVAVSEARRQDYVIASGLRTEAIRVIPNGLDFAQVLGLTDRIAALRLEERELVLVHPARLIRRKNIELGLQVTACLRHQGCDAVYAVTGAPDPHQADGLAYYEGLRRLASDLGLTAPAEGLPGVYFLGEEGGLSEADVRALYACGDALFFPSTGEGFGLPLVEASAHRLTLFCSNLPVHREVLGESAVYFDPTDDPAAISARIMQWWRSDPFPRHRRQLWQRYEMVKICQEHLEPLLAAANQST